MSTCLIELIKPYIGAIALEEVARHLKVRVGEILGCEFWAFALWLRVSGRGAVFVSPRKLSCWVEAIKEAIACCQNLASLEKLKTALEGEFQRQVYSEAVQTQLRQLIEQRWQQIELETAAFRQAETLTQSYQPIIQLCSDREALDAVAQLIRKNYSVFEPFPNLLQQLRQIWAQRREEILNQSKLNKQLIAVGAGRSG